MIAPPLNDGECLAKITQLARESTATDEIRKLASQFRTTYDLAKAIRAKPQRDDTGKLTDGPRVACDVSQRVRVLAKDPNCLERAKDYLAVAELVDPHHVRQLATIDTPKGRHTFVVEDGHPVVLDPLVPRNALLAGLFLLELEEDELPDADPEELLDWILEIAEEPAEVHDGVHGLSRIRRARRVLARMLTGKELPAHAVEDITHALERAAEAAPQFGPLGEALVDWAREALEKLGATEKRASGNEASRNALVPQAVDKAKKVPWERVGYYGGKGVATYFGLGSVYDPAYRTLVGQQPKVTAAAAPASTRVVPVKDEGRGAPLVYGTFGEIGKRGG